MTEEIIIDGVDVAGCDFYQIEANELYPKAQYCGSMRNTFCENEPDCYYKQLKRLEQENKQMKSALEEIKHILEIHKDELEECLHNDIDGMIQNKINEVLK